MTTSDDFVLAPETDDTGRLIIGTNAPLACDLLIWNGDTQNILIDRGNHLIQINGVNFNTNVNVSANNVFATTAVNGVTATFTGAGTFNNLIVGNTGIKVGSATDYFNLSVGANGVTTINTVDSDGSLGNLHLTPDGSTTIGDGGTTNYLQISPTGDSIFHGSGGLVFGEIYGYDTNTTLAIANTGIANKVIVNAFDTNGLANNMTPDATNNILTCDVIGKYLCTVSAVIASTGGGGGALIGLGVWKNNGTVICNNVHAHRRLAGGGVDTGSVSLSGIITANATDTVELWCWNESNADDVIVDDVTLSLVQVGG